MTSIVVINCGYVESSRACLGTAFATEEAYDSATEAIKSLASWLLKKFKIDNEYRIRLRRLCCKNNKGKCKYCPDCGNSLVEESFSEDELAYWIGQRCCGTANGWGDGWGMGLYDFNPETEESTLVTPSWDVVMGLSAIIEHKDRVCILEESGERHLAAWAVAIEENPENPAPEIPSWYSFSEFGAL